MILQIIPHEYLQRNVWFLEVKFRLDCKTVRPTDHFQFKIVWLHKHGARWRHYAHNLANSSKVIRRLKTGQSANEKHYFKKKKAKSVVCFGNLFNFSKFLSL
jgi:hypothetical protein